MVEANGAFDPDETLPLADNSTDPTMDATSDETEDKQYDAITQRLLHSLHTTSVDESLVASLLSHFSSVKSWDESLYQLVIQLFKISMSGGMEPVLCTRMLTDGLLPLASTPRHVQDKDGTDWIGKVVQSVVEQLLSTSNDTKSQHQNQIDEGIKILLPAFLHRMDLDEASPHKTMNVINGPADDSMKDIMDDTRDVTTNRSVDDILDQFCSHNNSYYNNDHSKPQITAALLSALREFDSLSSGRLSKRRLPMNNSQHLKSNAYYQSQQNYEYVDRPTSLITATIHSLKSQEIEAIPPLVYQLGLLPLGLIGDSKRLNTSDGTNLKGENEKQRGKRLRMLVLQGIVDALEDDMIRNVNGNKVLSVRDASKNDEWKWSRYTSLAHLGTCLRMDPELSKAMLALLGGELSTCSLASCEDNDSNTESDKKVNSNMAPFRYQKLSPFKLSLSLSVASSIPRIRTTVLEKIRDLIIEEETIRIKCGVRWDGTRMGLGRPWMKCFVTCLEGVVRGNFKWENFQENTGRVGHVLSCLIKVAQFAECGEKGGGMGSIQGGGCASMILQSLIALGFLLIDCVKKNDMKNRDVVPASALLANTLDMSAIDHASMEDTSSSHATARVGRMLLCYLFYQSAAASSHFMSSSLSKSSNEGGTSLCRSILKSTIDKLCGMAPNALEYGKVLSDLLQFSPTSLTSVAYDTEACDGLDNKQKEEVISLAMATNYIPMLIDTLSNIPGGGMHPHVATKAVIPTVASLLLLQASAGSLRPGLAGYLWKKSDIIDHVDHSYLLAKKSLFCIDEDKRKCAAKLLVSLIGVAAIASSCGNQRTVSKWQSVQDEMRSSLRRCLTQHQQSVRLEAYSSLMALLPTDEVTSDASQTQDSVSPKRSPSGVATQSPNNRSIRTQSLIPPVARSNLSDRVCGILASQLDRYLMAPPENFQDKMARQQRGNMIGSQLSQMEEVDQSQENENNMPFRFEMIVSMRPQQVSQGKPKKAVSIAQSLLTEALGRLTEPIGFLIAACNAASAGASSEDFDITDDAKHQAELCESIKSLRRRMAGCNDIEHYLKWLKSNKYIFDITNNSKRKMEMAVGKIGTLISVAVAAEALLGTYGWENDGDDGFIGVDTTSEEAENLFNLRHDAVTRASEIMSSFVNSRPKKKKLKERDTNTNSGLSNELKSKSSNREDEEDEENIVATTTDVNRAAQAKNRQLLEEAINNITPAMPQSFLVNALQKFGAGVESKFTESTAEDSDDEDDDSAITKRLATCMIFRRFLITKSIQLVGGANSIIKAGSPFCPIHENVNSFIASSLSLGQLMFAEFCLHCYQLERTSISPNRSSQQLPLTQLSMRAFVLCTMGMVNKGPFGVSALLKIAFCAASRASPSCKESWGHYSTLNFEDNAHKHAPTEELNLKTSLLAIVSRLSSSNKMCLYEELLSQSLHGEAMECASLILAAGQAFSNPNLREFFSVMMLKCFEKRSDESVGVLGIDFGEGEEADNTCLATVIDIAFRLSNRLDGETHAPIPPGFIGNMARSNIEENLRSAREKAGLSMTNIDNWPVKQHDRLRGEIVESGTCCTGIVSQVAWALTANLGVGQHFAETFGPDSPSAKQLRLLCIKTISNTSESNFDREKTNICQSITACIENALDTADFVTAKLVPNLSGNALELAQTFVACNLLIISKLVCASSPSAEFVDNNGTFASTLLKNAKRLFTNLVRFVLSFTSNPKSLISKDTKLVLELMTSTLKPRIAALLRTLQEKHETTGGKYLAESKIESHGRTASHLVFEKEKLDNALLKMATVLKQAGLKEESIWLGQHVVTSQERDFVIKSIEKAREREAPKKKTSTSSKRKVKEEPVKKENKKIKAKCEEEEENAASDDDDVSQEQSDVESDESDAAECEVVEEDSENDMEEDSGDDCDSEEAEFDE